MQTYDPVSRLIFEFAKLPGIGEKTATRLTYFVLRQESSYARGLADALVQAKEKTMLCSECFTFTDINPCRLCLKEGRNPELICIVEKPADVFSIEQAAIFKGLYHVLHGVLSPLEGIGPNELKIKELMSRLERHASQIREIIFATNPSVEGEATLLYLTRLIKPLGIKLTKLAYGIPMGGLLEYTDRQTIGKAFENRLEMT